MVDGDTIGQRFDMTPEKMRYRYLLIVMGAVYLLLAATAIYSRMSESTAVRFTDWMNCSMGICWIMVGLFGHLGQKTTLSWDAEGLEYRLVRKRDRITFPEMKRIRLERMKLEIERDGKPFEMDFGNWTYAQNVEAKSPLYHFLREQAEARSISITEK